MGRFTVGVATILRVTFRREALPPPPEGEPRPARRAGLVSRLLAPEALPPAPADGDPSAPGARPGRGLLWAIFSPEPLPPELPPRPARPSRWLAWLFAPEPLEPLDPR